MIRQKRMVRLTSDGEKIVLVSRRKNGNLRKTEFDDNLSAAIILCAADDAVTLYDGSILIVTGGNLSILN